MYFAEVYNFIAQKYQTVYDYEDGKTLVFDTPETARRFLWLNRGIISNYQITPVPEGFTSAFPCRIIY